MCYREATAYNYFLIERQGSEANQPHCPDSKYRKYFSDTSLEIERSTEFIGVNCFFGYCGILLSYKDRKNSKNSILFLERSKNQVCRKYFKSL